MAPIENSEGRLDGPGVNPAEPLAGLLDPGQLRPKLLGLGPVLTLLDGVREVGVEQPVLHGGQLRAPFGVRRGLPAMLRGDVLEGGGERLAEEVAHILLLDPELGQIVGDGVVEILGPPAHTGVVRPRMVVAAPVIEVLVDGAVLEPAPDPLARDGEAAVGAAQQPAGERDLRLARPPVSPVQDILAGVEELARDQPLVAALVDMAVAGEFADVETVVEDVREGCAREARLAGAVDVPFARQRVGEALEGQVAARVELEDADDGPGLLGVRPHRLLAVVLDVDVPVGRKSGGPALTHFLVHALENLGAQVVAVVLRHRRHHVERQRPGGAGAELVLDEGELDAAGVLELL